MFDDLIGNKEVKGILSRLAGGGRIPRSLLFAGDDGVGKRQFALEAARALVCRSPADGRPCGACASCQRVGKFAFPKPEDPKEAFEKVISSEHSDVGMVIPRGRNVLVEAIRDLEREANFRPFEAEVRVFIIDNAEKMNDTASNALLKTLEEPPPAAYIFLITSRPDSLLATIRSRCQTLRFSPVAAGEISEYLVKSKNFDPPEAALSARLSRGSIGRAISIDLKKFLFQRDAMLAVLRAILVDRSRPDLIRISERMNDAANKENYEENLDILQTLIRDAWLTRLGEKPEMLVNIDLTAELGSISKNAEPAHFADWLREIETMREGLIVNINRKIATDALFMEMAA